MATKRTPKAPDAEFAKLREQHGLFKAIVHFWYAHRRLPPFNCTFRELVGLCLQLRSDYDWDSKAHFYMRARVKKLLRAHFRAVAERDEIGTLATTSERGLEVALAADECDVRRVKLYALRKLLGKSLTFENWRSHQCALIDLLEVGERAPKDSLEAELFREGIEKFTAARLTTRQLLTIIGLLHELRMEISGVMSAFQNAAWEKIESQVTTAAGWNEVLKHLPLDFTQEYEYVEEQLQRLEQD